MSVSIRTQIAYLDGPRLRRSLVAACDHAQAQRNELNRINVFPVPDGDTGTNLALTVRAIADHLRDSREPAVGVVAQRAAQAAVLGARGNCGMMLSHFLLGFADHVGERERIGVTQFAEALAAGVRSLQAALERPVEGTILTVMRESANAAGEARTSDFVPLFQHVVERARVALARTPELLPVLRKAGVVDAGAKGFVSLLEGVVLLIHGDPVVAVDGRRTAEGAGPLALTSDDDGAGAPAAGVAAFGDTAELYRFCTEALVRGDELPSEKEARARLSGPCDSLIVIRSGDLLKLHLHTDDPEAVFAWCRSVGTLAAHKAEDMRAQHDAVGRAGRGHAALARRPVVVVTDSACDLPEEVVRAHGIHVTPLLLVDEDRTYRDRVDLTPDAFLERMTSGGKLPTTSRPAPADFLATFERAAEEGEAVLGVILASGLSGTFQAAEAAARHVKGARVHLVDSQAASLLQGLLVLKACELAELAMEPHAIVRELGRIRDRSGVLFTVDTFDRVVASGRVGRGRAWLGTLLDVKPILALTRDGRVEPLGKAIGRERLLPKLLELLGARIPASVERVRFGVAHVGVPHVVETVSEALRARFGAGVEILSGPATPVLATHLGPGAWAVAYMVEDG